MSDVKELLAEARTPQFESEHDEAWGVNGSRPAERSDLVRRLADALEAATVERAVVEAQALEQAAGLVALRYEVKRTDHLTSYGEGYLDALDWAEQMLDARAVEIREGRQ